MSEPIIEYRDEFNVMDFVSKYTERVSRVIDEQTLANVEHQLARYGYVKVVRCRVCKYRYGCVHLVDDGDDDMRRCHATPDGFCAWGEKASNFATCECGEDIELGNRESAVCPRCNRTVRA